jgi:tetratricopeptide (TPR) repeat protein
MVEKSRSRGQVRLKPPCVLLVHKPVFVLLLQLVKLVKLVHLVQLIVFLGLIFAAHSKQRGRILACPQPVKKRDRQEKNIPQPLYQEAIEFMEGVVKKLDLFSKKDKAFLVHYAYVVGNLGTNYLEIKGFSAAGKSHKKALTLLQQAGMRQQTATAYHQLGMVAEEERDWKEAKRNYREALKIFQEFNDRYSQAGAYHQLGIVATEEGDLLEGKRNWQEALKICQEFNDRYGQARTYFGLGVVTQKEKDYTSSLGYYTTALEIFLQYKDEYSIETTIENLSLLMQEWDAAEAIEELAGEEEIKELLRKISRETKKKSDQDLQDCAT